MADHLDQKLFTIWERFSIFQVVFTWRAVPMLTVATTVTNGNIMVTGHSHPTQNLIVITRHLETCEHYIIYLM
jgi:hypothetical protein